MFDNLISGWKRMDIILLGRPFRLADLGDNPDLAYPNGS
ncbi:hypothetical protein SAMN05216414_102107 [Nitrosovibrio sp. Nv17]|nr:hypothetical protein SAMN05216414_102107 [Nitrosovibrio sp. Nv17]